MASAVVGVLVVIAFVLSPIGVNGQARRAAIGFVFFWAGEIVILVSDSDDWLRAGLVLLEAAVLMLAELAASGSFGGHILAGLLWLGVGAVGFSKWDALGGFVADNRWWVMIAGVVLALGFGWQASRRLVV